MQTEVSTDSLYDSTRRLLGDGVVFRSVSNTLKQNSRFKHTVWTQRTANKRECHTIHIVWGSAVSACNRTIHLCTDNRCPNTISEFTINY